MKERQPNIGLARICRLFGITRQAYYGYLSTTIDLEFEHELIIKEVLSIRRNHPRIGPRKLYIMLEAFMQEHFIKMGRDALFDLLASYKLLIRRRKRMIKTTQSHHWLKKYPNLIKGYIPIQSNEIYVSDITYWKIETGYIYISLITDAYSHKIVGYDVSESLESECHLKITHHSDR